jgi:hypothetical protein
MKIVKHYEFAIEDQDVLFAKWGAYLEKSAKTPEKYPRYIFGPAGYTQMGDCFKGVSIMEIDNEDQLINYMLELGPELKATFELLFDGNQYVQAYMASKQ